MKYIFFFSYLLFLFLEANILHFLSIFVNKIQFLPRKSNYCKNVFTTPKTYEICSKNTVIKL